MQGNKGISLIVLVITIIVMTIIAGAAIISLNNDGIIKRADEGVKKSNLATAKTIAQIAWMEAYNDGVTTVEGPNGLEARVDQALRDAGINKGNLEVTVTINGVDVKLKEGGISSDGSDSAQENFPYVNQP